jgi:hypothetical protein
VARADQTDRVHRRVVMRRVRSRGHSRVPSRFM